MDDIRKGEIARLVLKERIRNGSVKVSLDMRREVPNVAKKIGVSLEEMQEFLREEVKPIVVDMIDEAFAPKSKKKVRVEHSS